MNKIIKHSNHKDDSADLVTDIDIRFGVKEPLTDGQPEQAEDNDQVSGGADKDPAPKKKLARLTLTMAEIKHIYNDEVDKAVDQEPEEVGILAKLCSFMTLPVELVSMAIIPNVDDEKINSWYMPIIPVTSVLAFVTITKRSHC